MPSGCWPHYARPLGVDLIVAAEARGFIFGGALARELGVGFVPARKAGKLPHETVSVQYGLEYGLDELHVHADALAGGTRVLIHDDVLATGGTAKAKIDLVEQLGGRSRAARSSSSWRFLGGRETLAGYDVHALVRYDEPVGSAPRSGRRRRAAQRSWPASFGSARPRGPPRTLGARRDQAQQLLHRRRLLHHAVRVVGRVAEQRVGQLALAAQHGLRARRSGSRR